MEKNTITIRFGVDETYIYIHIHHRKLNLKYLQSSKWIINISIIHISGHVSFFFYNIIIFHL
ncbi:hypothetical protein PUN28_015920 [Cardiocondyla obscurior]|uniref:Uncharacterized protein n=1 Tax=Cardiocondyla obscurior TaxID=286306 RepID=A0AAW2EQ19_9HYME